ncbi:uncharacterized protein F5Z01DRAFT_671692 [Emericellopsis atlantica]|uniref:Uncharacterized protein n=1 Tax=Emericellopsis atlantica TaxID=2614577 RepID=A0A9P7ZS13_9HYPO|nr:uncharacterized protein F5Z01DRAFT_671692 [Emericellopsis atlantica]KAG9257254.1 hypothetical protein F5Z01DRAFT_671692 [Emericellopsis atlantica]
MSGMPPDQYERTEPPTESYRYQGEHPQYGTEPTRRQDTTQRRDVDRTPRTQGTDVPPNTSTGYAENPPPRQRSGYAHSDPQERSGGGGGGLGNVSGMDSGRRDDDSYGGSYAGMGREQEVDNRPRQQQKRRDSLVGKIMEKTGGVLGNAKLQEKGHDMREAKARGDGGGHGHGHGHEGGAGEGTAPGRASERDPRDTSHTD